MEDGLSTFGKDSRFSNFLKLNNENLDTFRNYDVGTQQGILDSFQQFQGTQQPQGLNWMGQGGIIDTGAKGLQALSGLANALLGYKQYGLAKDQFAAEKGFANRNLQNQAQMYNQGLMNSANVGLALAGSTMSPEQRQAYLQSVEKQQLSTAPVV